MLVARYWGKTVRTAKQNMAETMLDCAGLAWARLGWARLGWASWGWLRLGLASWPAAGWLAVWLAGLPGLIFVTGPC